MNNLFEKYGVKISDFQLNQFEKYYNLLIEYNAKFNLTSITEKLEVYIKHFLDSAIVVDKLCGQTVIDIGSGGGFPAIPIKIMNDNLQITMVEATGKKCEFLKEVINTLNLKGITVVNGRAEELGKDIKFREKFDICTARAVARLNSLCEYCMPFVKVGGSFVSLKAKASEEIEEAKTAIMVLGGELEKIENYKLEDNERTLIFIKKVKLTDKKYPRGKGKERKNPL